MKEEVKINADLKMKWDGFKEEREINRKRNEEKRGENRERAGSGRVCRKLGGRLNERVCVEGERVVVQSQVAGKCGEDGREGGKCGRIESWWWRWSCSRI